MREPGRQIGKCEIGTDNAAAVSQAAGKADPDLTGCEEDVEVGCDLFGSLDRRAVPIAFAWIEIGGRERPRIQQSECIVEEEQRSAYATIPLDALDRKPAPIRCIEGLSRNTPIADRTDQKKLSILVTDKDR